MNDGLGNEAADTTPASEQLADTRGRNRKRRNAGRHPLAGLVRQQFARRADAAAAKESGELRRWRRRFVGPLDDYQICQLEQLAPAVPGMQVVSRIVSEQQYQRYLRMLVTQFPQRVEIIG